MAFNPSNDIFKRGTYEPGTGTYTSPTGVKQSRSIEYVPKGTPIVLTSPGNAGNSSGGGGGTSISPQTSFLDEELRKESERQRIATETKQRLIETQKIQDEKQRNITQAKIRLEASNERTRLQTYSSDVQIIEAGRQFQERMNTGKIKGFTTSEGTVFSYGKLPTIPIQKEIPRQQYINPPVNSIQPAYKVFPRTFATLREGRPKNESIGFQELINIGSREFSNLIGKQIGKLPEDAPLRKGYETVFYSPISYDVASYLPRPSDIAMFSLFSPYMKTGQQSLVEAIKRGDILPEAKTEFVADIKTVNEDVYKIRTITRTEIGGQKTAGISVQYVKDINERTLSYGKGISITKITKADTDGVGYKIISKSKEVGNAIRTKEIKINGLKSSFNQDIGKGVGGKAFIKDMRIFQERKVFGIDNAKELIRAKRTIYPRTSIAEQKSLGVIKTLNEEKGIYQFVGTTEKPRMYWKQFKGNTIDRYRLTARAYPQDINLKGYIKILNEENTGSFIIKGGSEIKVSSFKGRTGLMQKTVSKNILKVPSTTASINENVARQTLKNELSYKTSPALTLRNGNYLKEETKTRQSYSVKLSNAQSSKEDQATRQIFKMKEIERVMQVPYVKQSSLYKLAEGQKSALKMKEVVVSKPKFVTPRPYIPIPRFNINRPKKLDINFGSETKKFKMTKFRPSLKSSIALSEGFISKSLGRRPRVFREKDIGKAIRYYSSPFTKREAPRIIK